jgi:glycosyltransferase involved in cell wall biosynthesis/ribosomal protein S18 acetylase RimI-like enzyme
MRVAWVTPLAETSAVAEFSIHVAEALARRGVDVDLWTSESNSRRSSVLPVKDLENGANKVAELARYDTVVYNLGDTPRYHRRIYDQSRRVPGIVVLHDRVYQNLFVGSLFLDSDERPLNDPAAADAYISTMRRHYGDAGEAAAERSLHGDERPLWEAPGSMVNFPLVEEMLVGAKAAVVHSRDHADELRGRWLGPIAPLFLPSYPTDHELPPPSPQKTVTFVTVGLVNENKQIDRIIAALARDRSAARRVEYVIVGAYDDRHEYVRRLRRQVDRADLSEHVVFRGHVSDAELQAIFEKTDVFVNLRHPNLEGGSASLMRQLASGRAVVANDSGTFGEIPAEAIVRVSNTDASLAAALRRLARDADLRSRVGRAGARAARTLSADRYAAAFVDFANDARRSGTTVGIIDRVASTLADLGVGGELPIVERAAAELDVIAGRDASPAFVAIHELGPDDGDALAELFEENNVEEVVRGFDPFPLTEETAQRLAAYEGGDHYYIAREGAVAVGLSMLRGWDDGYDVPSFGVLVDQRRQGRGIGTALTAWTVCKAKELGAEQVRLSVYASNPAAYGIYARLGFVEQARDRVDRQHGRDERIVMVKDFRTTG